MSDHASLSPRTALPVGDCDLKSGAIDCEIEHRNIAYLFLQLKSDTDGPFLLDFDCRLLPSKPRQLRFA
jgi:hypothetical protein